jgi:hypothetical protein
MTAPPQERIVTPQFDAIDRDLLARWVRRRDQDPGDWLDMGDGVPRRIVKSARYHLPAVIANEVKPHTTFYFGDDGMKAGSWGCGGKGDAEIPWSRLTLVGVRRGRVRIPHHSVSWAAGAVGIDVSIECRVYRLTQERRKV